MSIWFWIYLGILILSIIIEVSTTDLTSFWFAIGALVAMIVAIFNVPWWGLLIIFSVISTLCIIFLRPIVKKKFENATIPTNADVAIGKIVMVQSSITPNQLGEIKYEGIIWSALCEDPTLTIPVGSKVEIIRIEGNKMVVKNIERGEKHE